MSTMNELYVRPAGRPADRVCTDDAEGCTHMAFDKAARHGTRTHALMLYMTDDRLSLIDIRPFPPGTCVVEYVRPVSVYIYIYIYILRDV